MDDKLTFKRLKRIKNFFFLFEMSFSWLNLLSIIDRIKVEKNKKTTTKYAGLYQPVQHFFSIIPIDYWEFLFNT